MEKKAIARKPNALINVKKDITTFQAKAILWILAEFKFHVKKEHSKIVELAQKEFEIPISYLVNDFQRRKGGSLYRSVKEQVDKVMDYRVSGAVDEREYKPVNVMSYIRLRDGSAIIEAKLNSDVVPILIDMVDKGYTEILPYDLRGVDSVYSLMIYELLLQYRKLPHVIRDGYTLTIDDLKEYLHLESAYPNFGDFNRRILKRAHKEINEKTSLRFEFEPLKNGGRGFSSVRFYDITFVTSSDEDGIHTEQTELFFAGDPLEGIFPKDAMEIRDKHTPEYITYYHKKATDIKNSGGVKNSFSGLLFRLLSDDPDNYYIMEKRHKEEEAAEDLKRAEREKAKLAEAEAEELRHSQYELRFSEAEARFNALSEEQQNILMNEVRKANPILSETFVRQQVIDSLMEKQ